MGSQQVSSTLIKPVSGWQPINFRELREYRDLFYFLVWRDVKVLYAQTVLGFLWAIFAPLIQILVFTLIFGKVAQLPTEGIPYLLYSTLAMIPWNYMSTAMAASSMSLVSGQNLLGKVYFPRLVFPFVPVLSHLVDFFISLAILVAVLAYYRVAPTWNLLLFPVFLLMMMVISAGIGTLLSAMAIRYRDIKFALQYILRLLIFSAPILYSATEIPEAYRLLYSLNPIVAVIEGFRACVLGTPIPWLYVVPGMITGVMLLLLGALYFKRLERVFADVI
jgi:lipopolysaccharide transport system permease protein